MTHQSTDYNTLATTWACSMLSLIIIITRLSWRYRQVGRMYLDDLWMGISLGPLLLRLAFIHVTLVWMTNNFDRSEYPVSQMSPLEIKQRIIGSKLVLPGRVFYAAFVWCMKICVLGVFERITVKAKPYGLIINILHGTLLLTFIAVVLSTFLECRPFHLYWQMVPAAECSLAEAQLMTMGSFNIITDVALIIIPLPIIIKSQLPFIRKLQLAFIFGVGIFLVGITIIRMPIILNDDAIQKARTFWASIEVLASCVVANAPVFHSLIRQLRQYPSSRNYDNASSPDRRIRMQPVTGQDSNGSLTRADGLVSIIETRTEVIQKIDVDTEEALNKSLPLNSPWRGNFLGTQVWSDREFPSCPPTAVTNKSAV